jgi:hypothetical protein
MDWQHRSPEVSAAIVADLVAGHGGRVLIQELFGGDGSLLPDCFTTFGRAGDRAGLAPHHVVDPGLLGAEGSLASQRFAPYLALGPSD